MTTPPKHDVVVCKKIDQLFGARRLAEQCEQLKPYEVTTLLPKLKELQLSIYCLDKYFEHTWNLSQKHINVFWSNILLSLRQIVGNKQNLEELVRDIRAYQSLEESIRSSSPSLLPRLQEYYHLKTCDVRLARYLIVRAGSVYFPQMSEYLRAWELFDLASEVCDDLDDIDEDLGTFNGNRFLLEIGTVGAQSTINSYQEFELLLLKHVASLSRRLHPRHPALEVLGWASERLVSLRESFSIRAANAVDIADCYNESLLGTYRSKFRPLATHYDLGWLQSPPLPKEEHPIIIL